jgi:hypothetical protein
MPSAHGISICLLGSEQHKANPDLRDDSGFWLRVKAGDAAIQTKRAHAVICKQPVISTGEHLSPAAGIILRRSGLAGRRRISLYLPTRSQEIGND